MVQMLERVAVIRGPKKERASRSLYYIISVTPHFIQTNLLLDHKPEILCHSNKEIESTYIV